MQGPQIPLFAFAAQTSGGAQTPYAEDSLSVDANGEGTVSGLDYVIPAHSKSSVMQISQSQHSRASKLRISTRCSNPFFQDQLVKNSARNGEVRFFGDISSEPASVASMVNKLSKRGTKLHFC
nr:hypothetical protein [Rhizobium laguerreae]